MMFGMFEPKVPSEGFIRKTTYDRLNRMWRRRVGAEDPFVPNMTAVNFTEQLFLLMERMDEALTKLEVRVDDIRDQDESGA